MQQNPESTRVQAETVHSMPIGVEFLLTAGKAARHIAAQQVGNGIDTATGAIDYAACFTAGVADQARKGANAVIRIIRP